VLVGEGKAIEDPIHEPPAASAPVASPAEATVASPEELVAEVQAHVQHLVETTGGSYQDTLNEVCFGKAAGAYNDKTKRYVPITSADVFLKTPERIEILRTICARIEEEAETPSEGGLA